MTTLTTFISKHPALAYFVLTFIMSWGGVLLVIGGPAGLSGTMAQDNPRFPLAVLAMVAGPCVTGILLTGVLDGSAGLRMLRTG
jgi:CAAX protease family protein